MPFFDFKCEKCGHVFNIRVSNADKDKVRCPECDHAKVRQLLSPFYSPGGKSLVPVRSKLPDSCAGCGQAGTG
ncbi:MAG: FmdB family zinc ribbon protein [Chitinophagales bacterium]